jgi:hypothetical protein
MNESESISKLYTSKDRMKILFKKSKGFIRDKQDMRPHKEPIVQLMRRSGKVEWFDGVKEDVFKFEHSDGEEYEIPLRGFTPHTFEYGGSTFRGFICDEDCPYPLPSKPKIYIDQLKRDLEKVWINVNSRKAIETKAITGLVKMIVIGVAVVIGGYILYKMLIVNPAAVKAAALAAENATSAAANATSEIIVLP